MKLYATVASERASKGQGGNDYLNLSLSAGSTEKSTTIAWIKLIRDKQFYHLYYQGHVIGSWTENKDGSVQDVFRITKGNKQKGECVFTSEESNYCDTHGTDRAH